MLRPYACFWPLRDGRLNFGNHLTLKRQFNFSRVGLGAHAACAHVSPVPSIHSVRWVFPNTVGRRLSLKARAFPFPGLLCFVSLSPGPTLSRGLVALLGNPLTVSLVRLCLPSHRPLAQHGLSCPRLQTLLRPDAPVWRIPYRFMVYPGRSLPQEAIRLTFPSLL
jgi:hypothetical protein